MHHTRSLRRLALSGASVVVLAASLAAQPQQVRIRVTNLAPVNGTALTPVWLGIHDGSFNLFTPGMAASTALERIAEDGNVMPLATAFGAAGFGTQGVAGSGPLLAGQTAEFTFMLDRANPLHRFLSYASMLLPSNDAFIGTMNPRGRALTDANGNFQSFSFTVGGNQVWDAGTEVNDEAENSTAFFGQTMPNTG
ncbi:MAG: spondin domain-containing protein, partial [Gemmatimonadaceae bacterium]|nr:spondin domain-containing protein [Gemmatimonadaceae bacterium]